MITAVDTNVLIDVFGNDVKYAEMSASALRKCILEGQLIVCDIVWAELRSCFLSKRMFEENINKLGIRYSTIEKEASSHAGELWIQYRKQGGKRTRIISDFLIAAHAKTQANRFLTRDRGFYRRYFAELEIVDPSLSKKIK